MERLTLIVRLAVRDLRYRRGEAALLLLAITGATTTLTLGLAHSGVTGAKHREPAGAPAARPRRASASRPRP
jgi:hypothetical protein